MRNVLCVAAMSKRCYEKALEMMSLYTKCRLKGQPQRTAATVTQTMFSECCGIKEEETLFTLLCKVIDKEFTIKQFRAECVKKLKS